MSPPCSPLRYPGGKQILGRTLAALIGLNKQEGGIYAEPYAGGCGAGLHLLFSERISTLLINDADRSIYAFWHTLLHQTDNFLDQLRDTPISMDEWQRQRDAYANGSHETLYKLGFATFFLNRCNRSGIIANGGVIGGRNQGGKWKIDARFNKSGLRERIERIALYRRRITVSNLDALEFLALRIKSDRAKHTFVYLDPPYFDKGRQLYLDYYEPQDHASLAARLRRGTPFRWVLTYDNTHAIRTLYSHSRRYAFNLPYSAHKRRAGKELLVVDPELRVPSDWRSRIPQRYFTRNS